MKKIPKTPAERFATYYCTNRGRATLLLSNARTRARTNSLTFELDIDWLLPKILAGVCEVTGLTFTLKMNDGKGHRENSFSPSLERRDNSLGYTKENTQVVCWIYNRAKGAFPMADLLTMLRALDTRK